MTIAAETSLAKVACTAISVCVASVASVTSVQILQFEIRVMIDWVSIVRTSHRRFSNFPLVARVRRRKRNCDATQATSDVANLRCDRYMAHAGYQVIKLIYRPGFGQRLHVQRLHFFSSFNRICLHLVTVSF